MMGLAEGNIGSVSLPLCGDLGHYAGKTASLTLMHPGRDFQDMRPGMIGSMDAPDTVQTPLPPHGSTGIRRWRNRNLRDGLLPALQPSRQRGCHRAYRRYIVDMYPSSRRGDAPDWDSAVRSVRRLWEEMCASDWENPDYEPGPVDLPMEADFKDPASQTADSAELSAQTKAMRAATEKARDAEAESYADYWRKRSTRER